MSALRWASALLRRLAGPNTAEADVLVGDLEEAHRARVARRGSVLAGLLTTIETADVALMLIRNRLRLPSLGMSWLDLKLAVRMLARYPVLSLIGTVSLALGVEIGAAAFAILSNVLWPSMPLPDGDRIVSIRLHDAASNQNESRLTADFLRWRDGTNTLTDVGAGWDGERNLTMGDGTTASVYTASVTASTFTLGRVMPVIGRVLSDEDARPASPPAIVIGQKLWRERFAADPAILERQLLFGDRPVSVVGVVPEAFRFPRVAEVWEPLRLDESAAPRRGIGLNVWARLRQDATLESATGDLATLAKRAAIDWPATHARLRPEVHGYADSFSRMDSDERMAVAAINVVVFMLIFVVSGNVALLMFARAAVRARSKSADLVGCLRFSLDAGRFVARGFVARVRERRQHDFDRLARVHGSDGRDFSAAPFPRARSAEDDEALGGSRESSSPLTLSRALVVALLPRMVHSDGSGSEPASGGTASTEASSATANTGASASARSSRSLRAS
jgi:hypothetical protein